MLGIVTRNYWFRSLGVQRIQILTYCSFFIGDNNFFEVCVDTVWIRFDGTAVLLLFWESLHNTLLASDVIWCRTSNIQTSKIISSPQGSYENVSHKFVVTTQYFLIPWTVIFLSSHWHAHSRTTSKIHVFSMDSTHSRPIY